jgi:hypothetical protein
MRQDSLVQGLDPHEWQFPIMMAYDSAENGDDLACVGDGANHEVVRPESGGLGAREEQHRRRLTFDVTETQIVHHADDLHLFALVHDGLTYGAVGEARATGALIHECHPGRL